MQKFFCKNVLELTLVLGKIKKLVILNKNVLNKL